MTRTLTQKGIDAIKPATARLELPDGRIQGLYLITQPSGNKSWAFRYRHGGRPRKMTLGKYPAIGLADARILAQDAASALSKGTDPAVERAQRNRESKAEDSLPDTGMPKAVESFLTRAVEPNNRSAAETRRQFETRILPAWKSKRIDEVSRGDVVALLDNIVDEGSAIMANRIFASVRRFFNWSVERGLIEESPCKGLKAPTPERSRDRLLTDAEIQWLWAASRTIDYPFGPMIRLLLLTGQRRSEVAGMRWDELDLAGRVWSLPRERAKNARAHIVPLTSAVIDEINALPKVGSEPTYLFTMNGETPSTGFSRAKRRIDTAMLTAAQEEATKNGNDADAIRIPNWRLHDLRRTTASGMARLGQPIHVVEAVLNHRSGTLRGIAAVYNRYDYRAEKHEALEAWAAYVLQIVK